MQTAAGDVHRAHEADHLRRLERIIQTQALLVQAELDLDRFMQVVVDDVRELTRAQGAVVELVEGDEIVQRCASGAVAAHLGLRLSLDRSLSGRCVREGAVLRCDDSEADDRVDRETCRRLGLRSMICTPLFRSGAPVGVLKVTSERPHAFGDGDLRMLELMAGALAAALGKQLAFDARARAEARLRASEERMRAMLEHAHDAVVSMDDAGRVSQWNRAAEHLFGWAPIEAMGQPLAELIVPPALREAHDNGLARFLARGNGPLVNRRFEVPALRRDGTRFTAEMSLTAFHDGSGWAAHAFVRDITERLAAERRLAASERRLRDLSDNMPALVSQIDRELRYVFANRQFGPMLGVAPESLVGRRIDEARDPAYVAQVMPQIERVLDLTPTGPDIQLVVDGELRDYQQHYVPERGMDGEVRGFYSVTFDITERRRGAEQLAAAERRTDAARKDTTVDLILGNGFKNLTAQADAAKALAALTAPQPTASTTKNSC